MAYKKVIKDKDKELMNSILEGLGNKKPSMVNINEYIKTTDTLSKYFKKKALSLFKNFDVKPHISNWEKKLIDDMDENTTNVELCRKYGVSKTTMVNIRNAAGKNKRKIKKEHRAKLGKLIKADVKKGYQFCDIKEKYGLDGTEVREAAKEVGFDYGMMKAKKMRNKKIINQYKSGKTYKDILGQFCDLKTASSLYQIASGVKKRIKNYDQLDSKIIDIIEKGFKKGHTMTKIARKLNDKGYTRTDGREYTHVDINNIKTNYNGGVLRKYRSVKFGRAADNTKRDKKILKQHLKGLSYREIGEKFKLSPSRIGRIIRRDLNKKD